MLSWWRRLLAREPALVRAPGVGRPRTYSADSGYVYQYVYSGFRRMTGAKDAWTEYVFDVTTGRAPTFPVKVLLRDSTLRLSLARDRELTASERYGVAKVALKRALDNFDHPGAISPVISPDESELQAIGELLDL